MCDAMQCTSTTDMTSCGRALCNVRHICERTDLCSRLKATSYLNASARPGGARSALLVLQVGCPCRQAGHMQASPSIAPVVTVACNDISGSAVCAALVPCVSPSGCNHCHRFTAILHLDQRSWHGCCTVRTLQQCSVVVCARQPAAACSAHCCQLTRIA
jgi:hypothetical protein